MTSAVVITNYNYLNFLPRALRSVASQSRAFDEVIVVDDGSQDGSWEFLETQGIVQLRAIRAERVGAARAKDLGVRACSADFVAVLDADDEFHKDFHDACLEALRRDRRAAFAYTDIDNRGVGGATFHAGPFDVRRLVLEGNYICTGVLLRRSAYLATPGFRMRRALEDWDLWLSFAERGARGAYVPRPLYVYHHHPGSRGTPRSESRLLGQVIKLRHPRLLARYLGPQFVKTLRRLLKA